MSQGDAGMGLMLAIIVVLVLLVGAHLAHSWWRAHQPLRPATENAEGLLDEGMARPRAFKRLLDSFSITDNMHELCTPSPSRTLGCLDSLRALSMFWIILGHNILFQWTPFVGYSNTLSIVQPVMTSYYGQFLISANFAVDTFFFLSGMLTAYVLIRKAQRGTRIPPLLVTIAFRWLRLTPLYAFVIGMYACLAKHMGSGPLWYRFLDELRNCKYWWTHLLYINNLYPSDFHEMCVPWAWYLALDMQFFIVAMVILKLYTSPRLYAKTAGFLCTLGMFFGGIVACWVLADEHDLSLVSGDILQNMLYDKPWARMPAYAVGLLTAYFMTEERWSQRARSMSRVWSVILLTVSIVVLISSAVFVTHDFNYSGKHPNWSPDTMHAYLGLNRSIWSLALAVLVVVCSSGNGGIVNKILALGFWEPFGKLTFAAYLVHPAIIRIFNYQEVQLFYYTVGETWKAYASFLLISYGVALVLYLVVEAPAAKLVTPFKAPSGAPRARDVSLPPKPDNRPAESSVSPPSPAGSETQLPNAGDQPAEA